MQNLPTLGTSPQRFLEITPCQIESEGIYIDLQPFNVPVDTSKQNEI